MADDHPLSAEYASIQDKADPLSSFREYFIIPTRADLQRTTIGRSTDTAEYDSLEPCTYLCGNSLGLQPTLTRKYLEQYLTTWAQKGVFGHFKPVSDTSLPPWLHVDDDVRADMANIVGAQEEEVAVMQTLTANLHLMMCSFYRPTPTRCKILLEGKAFPSDHFAVESQIVNHGYDPKEAMILLEPPSPASSLIIPTEHILATIDKHASELAMILLPGIQFYTGQLFDIATITAHAHANGIVIGWDLAHAAGNVPLQLHDWNVDFAAWCTYKYLNSGPGCIGGCFVHEAHGRVTPNADESSSITYRPRLSGWWGSQKSTRFNMDNAFVPIPGAVGFQLSNSSVADSTAVRASLDVFKQTTMEQLRARSVRLTAFLQSRLDYLAQKQEQNANIGQALFRIITPRDPEQRGAQLSVLLNPGLLERVLGTLEEAGVVVDERRPDVIRVAPAPLYNTFSDIARFMDVFERACEIAWGASVSGTHDHSKTSTIIENGQEAKGWSEII